MPRLFTRSAAPKRPDDVFLLKKKSYEIMASTDPISSVMHKFSVILDKGTRPNFPKDQLKSFLKTQVVDVSELTKIHDANDKPLLVVGSVKLYYSVSRLT